MNFGIRSILAPSSISSAVVARMFTPNGDDVLAISKGNLLYFYLINEKMEDNTVYECEKQIHMLIPIHHPYASYSNILVIFTNFQAKVINFSGETVQEFSLVPNPSKSLFAHLKYALHPNYLVLQLSPKHLEIYSISGNCTLKSLPYPVSIPCKAILDFTFVGPVFKVTDLVILTSEFADIKKLRYISLGSLGFTVDEVKEVQLPSDTYKIISLLPEKVSMIISFASKVATRIDYEKDIKPHLLTATIFTPSRIKNFDCIEENVYLYIDENGHYGTVRLENEGTIQFVKVGQIHDLLVILSLNHSLAFVGSTTGDSYLMENFHKIKTFKATGPPKKVTNIGNSLYLLCEHSTVKIQKKIPLKIQREILADDALSLFSFGDHILVSTKNKTEEINTEGTLIPNSLFNIEDKTVYFGVLQNGKLLIFEIVPDCNLTTFNINYFQQITLDKPVTMVQTCKNCVLVGLDSGQLYQIQKIRTDNGFIEAYNEALSNDNATKETNIYDLDKFSEFCINISDQANLKLLFSALKE
ncbi:hypothetical protein GPJ56_001393 [Histomonas meleagridis]|uniref:uncharacterized protein n=1 Tax=Histomonas meleagridis TaxID=135588 RepID=UPI003559CBA7|nr:hypothetical protein GPJ56_001393 [Histomonas meleagridis]KAH0798153.1 hypothetical protein GO595_008999 [Histomonas meleagridis]